MQYSITVSPVVGSIDPARLVQELAGLRILTAVDQIRIGADGVSIVYETQREDAEEVIRDVLEAHSPAPLLTNEQLLKLFAVKVSEGKDPHALATKVSLEMLERAAAAHRAWSNALLAAITTLIARLQAQGINVGDDILTNLTPLFYFATHADAVAAVKAQVEATTVEI